MAASTVEHITVPVWALTEHEQDQLLMSTIEKTATVPGRGEQRAWSRGGNVD